MNTKDLESFVFLAGKTFSNPSKEVKMEALSMFGKCICVMEAENIKKFQDVNASMLQLLTMLLQDGDELNAQKVLQVLIEIAAANATFYSQHVNDILKICVSLSMEKNLEPGVKTLGLEILCTILENEPQMVRRNQDFIDQTIHVCFNLMLGIEDDPEWDNTYGESVVDDENFDAGQVGLNRLSDNLNAKRFLPLLMPKLKELMSGGDWRMRHAGFVAMAQCCELFQKTKQNKDELFQTMANGAKDSHYRVQAAAMHCLGIMCTEFGKQFVNKFSSNILDIYEAAMDVEQHPRIQAEAAICIVNYVEKVSSKLLKPRLEQLLRKLFKLLNKPQKFIQENALCALSECAEKANDLFVKYYNDFTAHLMRILQQAVGDDYISVRLEALRCLTYIGQAVGAKTFHEHAVQAMHMSFEIFKLDGVEVVSILDSWCRIFQTCEESMAPFIQKIAEIAYKYASQTVKMIECDAFDEDDQGKRREKSVNASRVEEKVTAINLLFSITKHSKGQATAIVEPAAKILLPLVDDPSDDSIQEAAADALPGLIICLFDAMKNGINGITDENVKCLFNMVMSKMTVALSNEESPDALCSFATCIEKCIKINEDLTKTMPKEILNKVHCSLLNCLKDSADRMDARKLLIGEEGNDDEDIDKLKEQNEQEASLSANISDAVGALVEVYRDDFIPILQTEWETLNALLSPDALDIQKRGALYIFCDVVEHCSTKILQQSQHEFARHFKDAASNAADVCARQVGVFALGLLFEKSAGDVSKVLPPNDVLRLCFAQFTEQCYLDAEDVDDVQDNAALTIGRVCKFCPSGVNTKEVYPKWLNCFPIRSDEECAQWCYTEMIRLIGANDEALVGASGANIPKIIHWIADVAHTDMSNTALDTALCDLINKVKSNQTMMVALKNELPVYLMEKLQRLQ